MNVDFRSCINNWCYQHGTMGQYTRCKGVSNNGRTCHNPEIKHGSAIGGKPGGALWGHVAFAGTTFWCKQLGISRNSENVWHSTIQGDFLFSYFYFESIIELYYQ